MHPLPLLRSSQAEQRLALRQVLARNGMYMIIDDHSEDTTITSSTTQWVSYWKQLMTDVASDTPSMMHVIADIFNEPDHAGFTWSTVRPCLPA